MEKEGSEMGAMEAIRTRESVRRYTDQPIPEEEVQELLKAAMSAPSVASQRPWHFVVLKEKEVMRKVASAFPYAGMLETAAVAVLVCGDKELEKAEGFWPLDCAAATQNLLLAAHSKGIGGVWVGIYPMEARVQGICDILEIPAYITPFALIPLGYPAVPLEGEREERFDFERVHVNRW